MFFSSFPTKAQFSNNPNYSLLSRGSEISVEPFDFNVSNVYPNRNWKAKKIWIDSKIFPNYQTTNTIWINEKSKSVYSILFRKKFDLKQQNGRFFLNITADVAFKVYVNGIFVGSGPANIGSDYEDSIPPKHWFYSTYDVSEFLKTGENLIACEVFSFYNDYSQTTSGNGYLLAEMESENKKTILLSDTTWKCTVTESYSKNNKFIRFNSLKQDNDWHLNAYNENYWQQAATTVNQNTKNIFQNQLPQCFRKNILPDSVTFNKKTILANNEFYKTKLNNDITFTYHSVFCAYVQLSVEATSGDTIQFFPYEKNSNQPNHCFEYICHQGLNEFETSFLASFKYLKIKVKSKIGIKLNKLEAVLSTYPVSYKGSFACSDTFFTKLWKICRWSTQICMNDMFFDSPLHQEPTACTGDYFIEAQSNYYAFGDRWLPRQDLFKTAKILEKSDYDMFHTSYSLLWVQMLKQYYNQFHDTALINKLLPQVNLLMEKFESYLDTNDLVVNAPDYMFMDWITIHKFNAHHPPAVIGMGYMSAFYYKALQDAAYLNLQNGNKITANHQSELSGKIKNAINKLLWDETKMLYKDGIPFLSKIPANRWNPEDVSITTYSPHINTLCVLYDIAPMDKHKPLMSYVLLQKEIDLQPYFMHFVLSAIDHAGLFGDLGFDIIDKWKKGVDYQTQTLKENWNDKTDFGYTGDYSHAWGASPLIFLSKSLLGISVDESNPQKLVFKPCFQDRITWATGEIPVLNKTLKIDFSITENKYSYTINVPENVDITMNNSTIPNNYKLKINNKVQSLDLKSIKLNNGSNVIELIRP